MLNPGNKKPVLIAMVTVLVLVISGTLIYLYIRGGKETITSSGLPRMANLPSKKAPNLPPPPDYPPDAPLLETVRKALMDGIVPSKALIMAKELPDKPERADAAFLLLEYAAENEVAEAEALVGRYYDPSDDYPSGSIRKNAATAYEWYQRAHKNGYADVDSFISKLKQWAKSPDSQGRPDVEELMELTDS